MITSWNSIDVKQVQTMRESILLNADHKDMSCPSVQTWNDGALKFAPSEQNAFGLARRWREISAIFVKSQSIKMG